VLRTVVSSSVRDAPSWPCYRLREGVVLIVAPDGSSRLMDLAGDVCAISATGTMMLESIFSQSIDAACQAVAKRFGVGAERVRLDMAALVGPLERRRLLIAPGCAGHARASVASVSCWMIAPVVALCAAAPRRLVSAKAWVLLTIAFISTRVFGWPNTIRVWNRTTSGRRRDVTPAVSADAEILDTIDRAVARAMSMHPLHVSCKERALSCQALARAAGMDSSVVLGVDLFPFAMHCWCECSSRILADRYDGQCDRFTPIMVYS
jgi:hypothetical protein